MSDTKKMQPEIMVYTAVLPRLHDSAFCASEFTPSGVQVEVRQTAVSNIRNLLPSAKKATNTAGSKSPGQKKDAGSGVNKNNQDVICEKLSAVLRLLLFG